MRGSTDQTGILGSELVCKIIAGEAESLGLELGGDTAEGPYRRVSGGGETYSRRITRPSIPEGGEVESAGHSLTDRAVDNGGGRRLNNGVAQELLLVGIALGLRERWQCRRRHGGIAVQLLLQGRREWAPLVARAGVVAR